MQPRRSRAGERCSCEGPSGGGKSTLASLLAGLRDAAVRACCCSTASTATRSAPTAGGGGWSLAPQFHENHVLTGSVAFNLLMGGEWPPARGGLRARPRRVCRELGPRPLLDRMPAGLQQMVGETGWQLSHGERSRLFIARALLQNAGRVILDESFAPLDPENMQRALDAVLARPTAVLFIAHQ